MRRICFFTSCSLGSKLALVLFRKGHKQLHTHAFRENVGLTCRGIYPVYCTIHFYIYNTLLHVQCIITVHRKLLQCTEYYYSVQGSVTVYRV